MSIAVGCCNCKILLFAIRYRGLAQTSYYVQLAISCDNKAVSVKPKPKAIPLHLRKPTPPVNRPPPAPTAHGSVVA